MVRNKIRKTLCIPFLSPSSPNKYLLLGLPVCAKTTQKRKEHFKPNQQDKLTYPTYISTRSRKHNKSKSFPFRETQVFTYNTSVCLSASGDNFTFPHPSVFNSPQHLFIKAENQKKKKVEEKESSSPDSNSINNEYPICRDPVPTNT